MMQQVFEQKLQSYDLLDPSKKLLLAVSGGVDSIVLLDLVQNIPINKRPQVSIAHINHQLRLESNEEEQFVKELAKIYKIPFYAYHWEKKDQPESGIEVAARNIRYQFFKKIMTEQKIQHLMTAHHQDDQVETILMRLTRGSSLTQLKGIQEMQKFNENGQLLRPLLSFTKAELYKYAAINQLQYVEDESNKELTYTRNRFRNQIIPLLKDENSKFNEHVEQFVSDLTDLLKIAEDPIQHAYKKIVKVMDQEIQLDIERFSAYEVSFQRMIIERLLNNLYQAKEISYKTNYIELLREWLLVGEVNTQLDLQAGFIAKKMYQKAIFVKEDVQVHLASNASFVIEEINHWVAISDTESIGLFLLDQKKDEENSLNTLKITASELTLPLTIRHRQPGDRMQYAGLNGSKKIKDIFIDEKIPLSERDQAWIVEDQTGKIIWLVSYRKMNLFRAQETDKLTYILKYKKD